MQNTISSSSMDRLINRIKKEFKSKKLIGDVFINESEYALLLSYAKNKLVELSKRSNHQIIDMILVTALVQIGIKKYDGKLWPHIEKELGIRSINALHQQWINESVLFTLKTYSKVYVNRNDITNILMHGFVSDHFADEFFVFLFEYYRIDLERNLEYNTKELYNGLFEIIKRSDNTGRTYHLVKQTAQIITENTRGAKIRIKGYLKIIDGMLWGNYVAKNSNNRLINKLINWANQSKELKFEKQNLITHDFVKGRKTGSTPFIKCNFRQVKFDLLIPPHIIALGAIVDLNSVHWIIKIPDITQEK
jgi:hypothetical protein